MKSPIKYGLLVGGVVVLFLGVGFLVYTWDRPLGPALELPTQAPAEATSNAEVSESEDDPAGEFPTQSEVGINPTDTVETVCGGPPTMMILVSGVASDGYLYGLADAIRIVRIDFQRQDVEILALPRDLWVDIPGLESEGITQGKLNQAYFYGTEGMGYYQGSGFGSGLLAETLQKNFGLTVDHYLAVNMNSFRQIIDTIGGIDVYLADDVYRKEFGEPVLYLEAGSHHLDGKQAEMVARQRIKIGDYGRIKNQTVILKGTAAKMLSPAGVKALPDLINRLKGNVMTDLSPSTIQKLVCLAGTIDMGEDISYDALPADLANDEVVFDPVLNDQTAVLIPELDQVRTLLNQFAEGNWP